MEKILEIKTIFYGNIKNFKKCFRSKFYLIKKDIIANIMKYVRIFRLISIAVSCATPFLLGYIYLLTKHERIFPLKEASYFSSAAAFLTYIISITSMCGNENNIYLDKTFLKQIGQIFIIGLMYASLLMNAILA